MKSATIIAPMTPAEDVASEETAESRLPLAPAPDVMAQLDESHWDAQFAESLDVLETLFDEASEEYHAGNTRLLGE